MHFLKKGQKIRAWVDHPPSLRQCPKENVFFVLMSSLSHTDSPSCSPCHIFGQAWPQRLPQTFHARFQQVRHLCQATQTAQGAYKIFYNKKKE